MQTLPLPLTLADLEEVLAAAADTHRRLPVVRRGPRPPRSGWPDPALYAPAPWLAYGDERPRGTLAPPDPRAIDRMDVVLGWLSQLAQRHALRVEWCRLLWARANGYSFQRIADKVSWTTPRPCSWSTARRKHQPGSLPRSGYVRPNFGLKLIARAMAALDTTRERSSRRRLAGPKRSLKPFVTSRCDIS